MIGNGDKWKWEEREWEGEEVISVQRVVLDYFSASKGNCFPKKYLGGVWFRVISDNQGYVAPVILYGYVWLTL